MLFSSLVFLCLFLPAVLAGNFLLGKRYRNLWLLMASLFFYAWGEIFYVGLMLASIGVNYLAGALIQRWHGQRAAFGVLSLVVAANLGVLAYFKYTDFVIASVNPLLSAADIAPLASPGIHLPIGISFFTFQALSYVVDVYRRDVPVSSNLLQVGVYISLFPQLIAGPIIRYRDVASQIVQRTITRGDFALGVERFILGLAKKVLLANTLAQAVDQIFSLPPAELSAGAAWFGALGYALQIYFDFSGYSDMAIGLGRMLGFHYLENFNFPYSAQSIQEFWRRWHISLSNWFRDYLYIPLGGSRRGAFRTYRNLLVVFVLCGLWHGASWTFVVWGGIHGLFIVAEKLTLHRFLERLWVPFRHLYAMVVVLVAWVFFRCETVSAALSFLGRMLVPFSFGAGQKVPYPVDFFLTPELLVALVVAIVFSVPWAERLRARCAGSWGWTGRTQWPVDGSRLAVSGALLFASVLQLASGAYNPFIYFRF